MIIISTMGTSLFEKLKEKNKIDKLDELDSLQSNSETWKDHRAMGLFEGDSIMGNRSNFKLVKEEIEKIIKNKREKFDSYMAEVSSIDKIIENKKPGERVIIYPVCSDTILSVLAACILKEYYKGKYDVKFDCLDVNAKEDVENVYFNGNNLNRIIIEHLNAFDKCFEREGLNTLFSALKKIYKEHGEDTKDRIIFNITGGYKGVIPFMVLFAEVFDIPVYYKFENADNIIRIPNLPIETDLFILDENYTFLEELHDKSIKNLMTYNDIKNFFGKSADDIIANLENDNIIENVENTSKYKLTIFGDLLFERMKEKQNENRQNIVSLLVELQLYKYFSTKDEIAKTIHSYTIDGNEIDLYLEGKNGKVIGIEVKPAGNVPIWIDSKNKCQCVSKEKQIKYDKENSLEYSLCRGGLNKMFDKYGEKFEVQIYLYGVYDDIFYSVKQQLKELVDCVRKQNKELSEVISFYYLRLGEDYKSSNHWNISNERIKKINLQGGK